MATISGFLTLRVEETCLGAMGLLFNPGSAKDTVAQQGSFGITFTLNASGL